MTQDKPSALREAKQKVAAKIKNFVPRPKRHIGTAEGFLDYFSDLPQDDAKLGFSLRQPDWSALGSLAVRHCLVTDEWDEDFRELYQRRRKQADDVWKLDREARQTANDLLYTIAEIETWQQSRFRGAKPFPQTAPDAIKALESRANTFNFSLQNIAEIRGRRKPRMDDIANYLIYIMVAFLRHKGASAEAAHREATDFINACRHARNPEDAGFWKVKSSVAHFRRRNRQLASQIDADPFKYVLLETGTNVADEKQPSL